MKHRVGILISGRGSNMHALIRAATNADFPAEIAIVISNRSDAAGLEIASQNAIPTQVVSEHPFGTNRAAHEAVIDAALRQAGCSVVCLAGYMRLLSPAFVQSWAGQILNIHPSLLPAFPGLHTHARALEAGSKIHGCTVHLVTAAMDDGPILAQAAVPVLPGDSESTLATRVLDQEHIIYPIALSHHLSRAPCAADHSAVIINPCA